MTFDSFKDDTGDMAPVYFTRHVWTVVSFGERLHLTRNEMATILEDIAEDIKTDE